MYQATGSGIVVGCQQDTAWAQALDKFNECSGIVPRGGETVRVVVFQVADHSQVGLDAQEHTIIFIGFDYKGTAFSGMGIARAQVLGCSPDDKRGILPQAHEQPGDHRGDSGFPMRSGDREHLPSRQQASQDLGALEHRDASRLRRLDFDVTIGDCRRAHN